MQFSKNLSWQGSVVICWNLDPYMPENKGLERENGWSPPKKRRWTDLRNHAFFHDLLACFWDSLHRKRRNTTFPWGGNKNIATRDLILFSYLQIARFKDSEMYCKQLFSVQATQSSCFVYQTIGEHIVQECSKTAIPATLLSFKHYHIWKPTIEVVLLQVGNIWKGWVLSPENILRKKDPGFQVISINLDEWLILIGKCRYINIPVAWILYYVICSCVKKYSKDITPLSGANCLREWCRTA